MRAISTLRQNYQEEEDVECLFKLNCIHWNISSMKATILDPEVKVPNILVRDNELDSGKSDIPASNKFSSSDQKSDVTPQELSER